MRSDYKGVWTALSESLSSAKMHVSGTEDEATFETSGAGTSEFILNNVGIDSTDVVLEIGCGIGRVGKHLAGRCRRWIGADVSPNMLAFAAERLRDFSNVEFVELSGNDLRPSATAQSTWFIARLSSCIWRAGIATDMSKRLFAFCAPAASSTSIT